MAGPAVICAVKFIPIAGYQPDNPGIRLMSQTNEIEVWLIPVRNTKMYVPYRIVSADADRLWLSAGDLDPGRRRASRQRRAVDLRLAELKC